MSKDKKELDAVVDYIFEVGQLRLEARHGWLRLGRNPESVAEHSHRAACLGYLLAKLESFSNPELVATMVLFHDAHEVRIGDTDTIQKKYVKIDEWGAAASQVKELGGIGESIFRMWQEVDERSSEAGIIAKDAELLEMVFMARELAVDGTDTSPWVESARQRLKTVSAKELLESVLLADPHQWWKKVCAQR
jgi:putative hydrolase of HD superfamily